MFGAWVGVQEQPGCLGAERRSAEMSAAPAGVPHHPPLRSLPALLQVRIPEGRNPRPRHHQAWPGSALLTSPCKDWLVLWPLSVPDVSPGHWGFLPLSDTPTFTLHLAGVGKPCLPCQGAGSALVPSLSWDLGGPLGA